MNEMWEALEKYQPFADKRGFGAAWRRMTADRTPGAARDAAEVAVWGASWGAGSAGAWAAARAAARGAANEAIQHINKAIAEDEAK